MRLVVLAPLLALAAAGCATTALGAMSGRKPDLARMLQNADENGDGVVTCAEYADARRKLFARLDRNGDGYLGSDDVPGRFAARIGGREGGLAQAIALLDKNGDGRISRDEFVAGPGLLFDRADTDHDGVIDARELAAFRAAVAARGAS
ncbi:EF-hand domain-containing protein [Labrys monachus]|uniref:EF-hand domain-containing protein n=1 Tax=Labrys monachus TaxID=217067 RepID=A0ABU0FJR4_9HYPH|nr:EF-hand domain-containing protein [Labrys monachus]MDQ0394853.1 hypothetical protein [Labrys monachus]